ncbi:hypothetical protein EX30DRAFT_308817 [Ascodesmis nigricans]|uniref:Uncharacterized protein n=1 Tax=Ascodesmis nigricans TaxID=341454 RepID=A0A4S2MSU0_9PEZI|nr:hypothetical protein EX30DRAFT_308817 [Ascodesmis nigricans]
MPTTWHQKTLTLPSRSRGAYLITSDITSSLPELRNIRIGLLTLFIQHTSCALSLNENYDPDVRADMVDALDRVVPAEGARTWGSGGGSSRRGGNNGEEVVKYRHDAEGEDDMPAHVKSSLVGATVTVPISEGRLALGTWQGIYYLEFRKAKHSRRVVATIQGETME